MTSEMISSNKSPSFNLKFDSQEKTRKKVQFFEEIKEEI
jgi:hypothetical protein